MAKLFDKIAPWKRGKGAEQPETNAEAEEKEEEALTEEIEEMEDGKEAPTAKIQAIAQSFMSSSGEQLAKYAASFKESALWDKLGDFGKKLGATFIELLLTLFYALNEVPAKEKALIIAALGYFILPMDLLPDFLPFGFADDAASMTMVLKTIRPYLTPKTLKRAHDEAAKVMAKFT